MNMSMKTDLDLVHTSDLNLVRIYGKALRRSQFSRLRGETRRSLLRYGILEAVHVVGGGRVNRLTAYGLSLLDEVEHGLDE